MKIKVLMAAVLTTAAGFALYADEQLHSKSNSNITIGTPLAKPMRHRVNKGELQWQTGNNPSSLARRAVQKERAMKATNVRKASPSASEDVPILHGAICYLDEWTATQNPEVGIYTITSSDVSPVVIDNEILSSYGHVYAGDKYFATVPEVYYGYVVGMKYHVFDTRSWTKNVVDGDYNFCARAMAFDPISRDVYAINRDEYDMTYSLVRMSMQDYSYTKIREMADFDNFNDWSALMCSPQGELYGIIKTGELVKFNKITGEYTVIGNLGITSDKMTSATIDPTSGRCYYVHYYGDHSKLVEINLNDATVTDKYEMPQNAQVLSLFIPETAAAESAPATATGLSLNFEDGSKNGTLAFVAPTVTMSGAELSGELSYTVKLNGVEIASGNATAGMNVNVQACVTSSGEYTAAVCFSNSAGAGAVAYASAWIGNDIPTRVENVKLVENSGKLQLTWDAVTAGTQNGWFDASAVTYTVKRYPEGDVVATDLKSTSFEDQVPTGNDLKRTSYGVMAVYGDSEGMESRSNNYISGYLTAPFSENFDKPESMELFTIVNANNDDKQWEYYNFSNTKCLKIEYSSTNKMDDYAVLHPIWLESGHRYEIGWDIKSTPSYTEKFSIIAAKDKDLESLREADVIVPETEIKSEEFAKYSNYYVPEESGLYYVAVYGSSEKYMNKLFADNVFISEGTAIYAPDKVTDLIVTPDKSGKLEATISFVVPTENIDGGTLQNISAVIVERDGKEVARVNNPSPGSTQNCTDKTPTNGINSYTVYAVNNYGKGLTSSAETYIGIYEAQSPDNIACVYGTNTSEAILTWDAVTEDIMGHQLSAEDVTYNITRSIGNSPMKTVAEGVTECSYTDQAVGADAEQKFVFYGIEAVTAGGKSQIGMSNIYPLGAPYSTPAHEDFDLKDPKYIWITESPADSYTSWDIYDPSELPFESFDGNEVAVAYAAYGTNNNTSSLYSGLFDLNGIDKPVLTFYLFDIDCTNTLSVRVNAGGEWNEISKIQLGEKNMGWRKINIDLSAYQGKTICLDFFADCKEINILGIDNMRITNDYSYNLSATSIKAPKKVNSNEPFKVSVSYENSAKETMSDYTIELYRDGAKIAECDGAMIEPMEIKSVEFDTTLPVTASIESKLWFEIKATADEYDGDNKSKELTIGRQMSSLPKAGSPSGEQIGNAVSLKWDKPDLSVVLATPSTDGVESLVPFSIGLDGSSVENDNLGEWKVYDIDGLDTYPIGGGLHEYPNMGMPQSFIAYNGALVDNDVVFGGHNYSQQCFICPAGIPTESVTHNDDWLVSPELAGIAQRISFYARSVSISQYGADSFEILTSSTGSEPADFTLLESCTVENEEWTEFSFDLPDGTRYFAIRCISEDRYAFMVDDITMITSHDVLDDLELLGYNVYRDGASVTNETVEDTIYSDVMPSNGVHKYQVSCLYNHGESEPTDSVEINFYNESGVEVLGSSSKISVIAGNGVMIISGAEGCELYVSDSQGRVIYSTKSAESVTTVSVASGVYAVKVGNAAVKVAVP